MGSCGLAAADRKGRVACKVGLQINKGSWSGGGARDDKTMASPTSRDSKGNARGGGWPCRERTMDNAFKLASLCLRALFVLPRTPWVLPSPYSSINMDGSLWLQFSHHPSRDNHPTLLLYYSTTLPVLALQSQVNQVRQSQI